ncbi:MAG: hypothetical protein ACK4R6_03915 [Spirosomataceae bacterium]
MAIWEILNNLLVEAFTFLQSPFPTDLSTIHYAHKNRYTGQ